MNELKKVRAAIVGCGMISNIYIKNLIGLYSIIDLVALCDLDETRANEKAAQYSVEKVMSFDEVLESDEIELVINLTGPAAHYDVIKKALLGGKHVYSEKMLCTDLQQGKELIEIAESKNLYLGVAPDTFLGAGLQTARKVLDAGLIGQPTSCIAAINRNQPFSSEFFPYIKFEGGGFPYDMGVYYVTAILSLLGPVKTVVGFSGNLSSTRDGTQINKGNYGQTWKLKSRNRMVGSLEFRSGVLGNIHFDGESIMDEQPHIAIYGTEGILYLGDPNTFNGYVKFIRKGMGCGAQDKAVEIPFTHGFKDVPVGGEPGPFDWGQSRGLGAAELAWSLRKGRKNRASKEFGLHTMEVLSGIDTSCDTGKFYIMTTTFERPKALPSGYLAYEMGFFRSDSEMSLTL